jgi:hypothetical protein
LLKRIRSTNTSINEKIKISKFQTIFSKTEVKVRIILILVSKGLKIFDDKNEIISTVVIFEKLK